MPLAHDDDAGDHIAFAVEIGDAPPIVGSEDHLAHVPDADRRAAVAHRQGDIPEILDGSGIPPAADHVLGPAELDEPPARIVIVPPDRLHHPADGDVVELQPVGVEIDLVLLAETADGRHFGHPRHRLEVVAQVPVLVGAELGQALLSGRIDEHVLEHPAQARGIGSQLRLDPLGKPRQNRRQVLLGPRTGPVDVGPLVEDDIDEGIAEVGEAAHGPDPRSAQHGRDDRIGDLILEDVGAAVPPGVDDHLGLGEIRNGVERDVLHGPPPHDGGGGDEQKNDQLVVGGKIDDPVNHGHARRRRVSSVTVSPRERPVPGVGGMSSRPSSRRRSLNGCPASRSSAMSPGSGHGRA